jgi:hypothetical protein
LGAAPMDGPLFWLTFAAVWTMTSFLGIGRVAAWEASLLDWMGAPC